MFGFLRRKAEELFIDRGTVNCPVRGDVEVDRCYACAHRIEIDERASLPFVRCEPAPPLPRS